MTLDLPPTIWDRAADRIAKGINRWRFDAALKQLQERVGELVATAHQHNAMRVPSGHEIYRELQRQASALVAEFCAEHKLTAITVESRLPGLLELARLAGGTR